MNYIGSLWKQITEESQYSEPGWYSRRVFTKTVLDISAAILKPECTPALLVEIHSSAVPSDIEYPKCKGFELFPETSVPGPHGRVRLCLLLLDNLYYEVFESLCLDVAEAVLKATSDQLAVQFLLSRLRVWHTFMLSIGHSGLGIEEQVGLFAELCFLRNILNFHIPSQTALQAWRGPLGDDQDFSFKSCSVEVKGTTVYPSEKIRISTLSQLDESGIGHLFLCHSTFEPSNTEGINLPEIIHEIRAITDRTVPSALSYFNDLLLFAGYIDIHEHLYSCRRYILRENIFFRVANNFPRICISEVRKGILSGRYTIAMTECRKHEVDNKVIQTLIEA